jgi:hypothetical protein
VARVIAGDTYDIRSEDVLCKLGWNNLEERRNNHNLRSNKLMLRLA